jgi:AcrR family transcriptional regulator
MGQQSVEPAITAAAGKAPRTPRGERTMRKILDAALAEFGERGFSESSIVSITGRAHVALGTFYTYFDSKEALFAALVEDMSARVREEVAPALSEGANAMDAERRALAAYLDFAARNKEVYRIIDESEFVAPDAYRRHYETVAARIIERLRAGADKGELRPGGDLEREVQAWAAMGMNVFLGLRFAVWGEEDPERVAAIANDLITRGLGR